MGRSGKEPTAHYIADMLCPRCALCAVLGPPTTQNNADPRSPGGKAEVCQEGGRKNHSHARPTAKPCCPGGRIRDMSLSCDLEDEQELPGGWGGGGKGGETREPEIVPGRGVAL